MPTERFDHDELDRSVRVPWYLPHWSAQAASAATCTIVRLMVTEVTIA